MKSLFGALTEMTMKTGDLTTSMNNVFKFVSKNITDDDLTHIGDIDSIKVMRFEKIKSKTSHNRYMAQVVDFLVDNSGNRVGMMTGNFKKVNSASQLWKDGFRVILEIEELVMLTPRTGLGEKYLYFLKNVMKTPLLCGDIHSSATQDFLKKHNVLQRFKISWYNINTGEIQPFDDSKYSTTSPTGWQALIESDQIPVINQFKTSRLSLHNTYEWLFNE